MNKIIKNNIVEQLKEYGLPGFLIDDLIKNKKVSTMGGDYIIKDNIVYKVTNNGSTAITNR